jgi:coenzyme F420-reducing hydrogenase gamma subunit
MIGGCPPSQEGFQAQVEVLFGGEHKSVDTRRGKVESPGICQWVRGLAADDDDGDEEGAFCYGCA